MNIYVKEFIKRGLMFSGLGPVTTALIIFIISQREGISALSGMQLTPEDYSRAVEKATVQDVANAAKTLALHTVYFLRGEV